jgi:hypothetical protein
MTANVSETLLRRSRGIESDLVRIADRYHSRGDARWLFAKAHSLITKDINRTITLRGAYRDPNALLRFKLRSTDDCINDAGAPRATCA